IGHRVLRIEGHQQPSRSLDQNHLRLVAEGGVGPSNVSNVYIGRPGGGGGGGGRGGEREGVRSHVRRIERPPAGRDQLFGVVSAAGFARLHRRHPVSLRPRPQKRTGNGGLAYPGVGGGDEQALQQTSRIDSAVASTSRSISSSVMESGGMRTSTGPRGRRMTPRLRIAAQTRAPIASSYA